MQHCPHCQTQLVNPTARFCPSCGQPLRQAGAPVDPKAPTRQIRRNPPPQDIASDILQGVGQGLEAAIRAGQRAAKPQRTRPSPPTGNLPIPPRPVGDKISYYTIRQVFRLRFSNYYLAENMAERSSQRAVLLHETRSTAMDNQDDVRNNVLRLGRAGHPGILQQHNLFSQQALLYSVAVPPAAQGWHPIEMIPEPDQNRVLQWALALCETIVWINQNGYSFFDTAFIRDVAEYVVIDAAGNPLITNLTLTYPLNGPLARPERRRCGPRADIGFIGRFIYNLITGAIGGEADISSVPVRFQPVISRVRDEQYSDLSDLRDDLKRLAGGQLTPLPRSITTGRNLRQTAGYSTDVGQTRQQNQDFVGKYTFALEQTTDDIEVGLYIVADGMGGHQGGERASRHVVQTIINDIQAGLPRLDSVPRSSSKTVRLSELVSPGDLLTQVISAANANFTNLRNADAPGRDRGTTITMALVIGNHATIANVGDSRTYHIGPPGMAQITEDHSLVARMVAAGMVTPEELRSHPQRNQIYRALGLKAQVEVDVFEVSLQRGDRLLLCSDGLWEMVDDHGIAQILGQGGSPQSMCDRLIAAANQAGGEDNISAILVELE